MGSGGCSGADFLLSRRVGAWSGPSTTRCVECEDCLRLRGWWNVADECSEASGVAGVIGVGVRGATVTGLDGALPVITGGSEGILAVLLQQPMAQWVVYAGASGR